MKEKIALGFGDNVDYEIVWDSKVIENLIVQYDIHNDELDINRNVSSERDLIISILSFLKSGSGGERIVASSEMLEGFAHNFEKKITLGGTPVRAAIAIRKLGYTSALHLVTRNDHVRNLLPEDCPYVCSNTQDSLHPHVIVQFDKGTRVKANNIDICSSQANRIIYHHDDDNISMSLNEDFSDLITDAKVFLISGFNAMQSEILLSRRLESLLKIMEKLPEDVMVFYEDAGYHEPTFRQLIFRTLMGKIYIVSLNEDELQTQLGRKLNLLDVFQIKEALVDLQKIISVPVIVVHSRYWALAYGEDVTRFSKALKGGTTMATTRFCYGDDFTIENYNDTERLSPNKEGARFSEALNELLGNTIACVPVAQVESSNATTIGLGDAFVGGFLPTLLKR
jgi:ADP-dependent phosphofructokinase/glucokinase